MTLSRLHPFTSLAVLLAVLALGLLGLHHGWVAACLFFVALGFSLLEFKKYTSWFQFSMILATGLGLGAVLDLEFGIHGLLTMSLFLASAAVIARQAFMQQFTYVNLLWLDSGVALLATALYLSAVIGTPFNWVLWLLPLLPLACAVGLTFSYIQDAQQMLKRTKFGYKVQVGRPAPDFELPDQTGAMVRLSDYRGKHPVLLIFVRGDWCPGCHMMLRTYERNRLRFMEKGVHVVGVGPDDIGVNKDMVQRIGVGYRMLSDDAQAVSGQYGVVYSNPIIEQLGVDYAEGIPLPASFLVDVNGIIRYVSRPDRVGEFLDPSLIFGYLDQLPAEGQVAWS